tara:strand:- start:1361 stop:1501 length:141 start_codon:yes stop_codon:yes gene_type:complete
MGHSLWHNIELKRKSGKKMRKKGAKGAPTDEAIKASSTKTAKKRKK